MKNIEYKHYVISTLSEKYFFNSISNDQINLTTDFKLAFLFDSPEEIDDVFQSLSNFKKFEIKGIVYEKDDLKFKTMEMIETISIKEWNKDVQS